MLTSALKAYHYWNAEAITSARVGRPSRKTSFKMLFIVDNMINNNIKQSLRLSGVVTV
jgi:hypothetical protein